MNAIQSHMVRPHIVLVAGGTGGHVIPALALASELARRRMEISFITDIRGKRFIPANAPAMVHQVRAATFSGRTVLARLLVPFEILAGLIKALVILRRIKPAAQAPHSRAKRT